MLKIKFIGFLLAIVATAAFCQTRVEYKNIDSFVKSFKAGSVDIFAEGDVMGKGRADWVGGVKYTDDTDTEIIQIYILEKLASGNYAVVEKSESRGAFGGTGNYYYDSIVIRNKSIFVSFGFHWHEFAGNTTSQFKLYNDQWRMIGLESNKLEMAKNDNDTETSVSTSENLLTGDTIEKTSKNDKQKTKRLKVKPRLILFKDYSGGDL